MGFSSDGKSPRHFAVVKIGGEVIEKELEVLSTGLAQLCRLGLTPVVVHGAGPQMNQRIATEGVEPQYVGGNMSDNFWL